MNARFHLQRLLGLTLLLGAGLLLYGCEPEGVLSITVDLPTDARLDPTQDQRLAQLKLVAVQGTTERGLWLDWPGSEAASGNTLDLGTLPPGYYDRIELLGYASDGTLVGYGRALQVTIPESKHIDIPGLRFRKPVAYLCGEFKDPEAGQTPAVIQVNTSVLSEHQILPSIPLDQGAHCSALATTPDGGSLLVVTRAPAPRLYIVDTKASQVTRQLNAWEGEAEQVGDTLWAAVSVEGHALFCRYEEGREFGQRYAVYAYLLDQILNPPPGGPPKRPPIYYAPTPIGLGMIHPRPGGGSILYLISPPGDVTTDCSGSTDTASQVVALDLVGGGEPLHSPPLVQMSSLAYDSKNDLLWATMPCANGGKGAVALLDPLTLQTVVTLPTTRPPVLVAPWSHGMVTAHPARDANGSRLGLGLQFWTWDGQQPVSVLTDKQIMIDDLHVRLTEPTRNLALTGTIAPTGVWPLALGPTADGSRLAILFKTAYDMSGTYQWRTLSVAPIHGLAYGYVTVDVVTNAEGTPVDITVGSIIRTYCEVTGANGNSTVQVNIGGSSFETQVACEKRYKGIVDIEALDSQVPQFRSNTMAVLYGK